MYAWRHAHRERILLYQYRKLLLCILVFQYIHKVCTNIAYILHTPRETLYDVGFAMLPALSPRVQIVSEIVFFIFIGCTIALFASPFFTYPAKGKSPTTYTVVMVTRWGSVLASAQFLRCLSFLSTSLPGPNYHCRPGSPHYQPPTATEVFTRLDAFFGCGDLVFSSHTIFVCCCALVWHKYGNLSRLQKVILWCLVGFFGCLVIAARKHYTLDIVVALYTVPLIWIAYDHLYPDPQFSGEQLDMQAASLSSTVLPIIKSLEV